MLRTTSIRVLCHHSLALSFEEGVICVWRDDFERKASKDRRSVGGRYGHVEVEVDGASTRG